MVLPIKTKIVTKKAKTDRFLKQTIYLTRIATVVVSVLNAGLLS